jgi:glycosyltransferase involved in cell wall biosynthesis
MDYGNKIGFDLSPALGEKGGMRILHVMAGSSGGGAETAYAELTAAQQQSGQDVIAACRPSPRNDALRAARVNVNELPFGGPFDFKTRSALKKLIAQNHPDVVISWMNRAAAKLPKGTYVPWVARLGGYYDLKYYKGVDHFVVNAPDIGRWMREQGVPENKITYIPNFAEMPQNVDPIARASLDTPDDAFVFLTLSRLHTNKAIDTFLRALAAVPGAYAWITGDGPEEKKLKFLATELGVQDRVRFLGWRDDRWALLAACDAFVLPSRHEPFGNAFMQAWAAGRPLVTTASQGPSCYVENGVNGLVTPIDDSDALASAMRRVMSDAGLRASLAAAGQAKYRQAFDKQAILSQWQDILSRLVKSR